MVAAVIESPVLLDVKQVADVLRVSTRHVDRMADGGLMPRPLKLGKLNRWPKQAFDDWLTAGAKPIRAIGRPLALESPVFG